jgi:hypothetical protein
MRRLFVEILVVPLIWLAAFAAIGIGLAILVGGHGSVEALEGALFIGAFGAVGEVAYSIIERAWRRPRLPRWFLVAAWTLVAPQIALLASEIHSQRTQSIIEGHVLILIWSIGPVIVVAHIASWPFRGRRNDFTTDP